MTAAALGGLLGVALFVLAGLGLAELVVGRQPLPGRLGYAYLLGVCWVGTGLYAVSHLLGIPLRAPAVLTLTALPAAVGLIAASSSRPTGPLATSK